MCTNLNQQIEKIKKFGFADLVRKVRIQEYRKMVNTRLPKPNKNNGGTLQPVLPLIPEEMKSREDDKAAFISLELKTRAGTTAHTYKKYVRKFEEGTPQEWIDLLRDFEEIWTQNNINGGADRTATVRSLLRGDSLTIFDNALEEARTEDGNELPLTAEMVTTACQAVSRAVFPHRALEMQKLWMQRGMKKPYDLSTRKTAAALTRINNSLPFFPGATENDKFSDAEIVGLLEWSLPQSWRAKFDLDGYVPTQESKAKLIEACEAIERNESIEKQNASSQKKKDKEKTPHKKNTSGSINKKKFYCSLHGKNSTHNTSDCFTMKKQKTTDSSDSNGKTEKKFSNRAFRKELNLLSKKSSKKKVLEQYAMIIAKEKAKLQKQERKNQKSTESGSDSDDMSVNCMEKPIPKKKKKVLFEEECPAELKNRKKRAALDQTDEERAFMKEVYASDMEDDESE